MITADKDPVLQVTLNTTYVFSLDGMCGRSQLWPQPFHGVGITQQYAPHFREALRNPSASKGKKK